LQLHSFIAANVLKKPLIIEEFGLTWFKKTLDQQRVLFKVRYMGGGCLLSCCLWQAAELLMGCAWQHSTKRAMQQCSRAPGSTARGICNATIQHKTLRGEVLSYCSAYA
jgi:hypothetical protein